MAALQEGEDSLVSEEKKDKGGQPSTPPSSKSKDRTPHGGDDLEKTIVDLDLSHLRELEEEQELEDETVVVRMPPKEDSGVFEDSFFQEEETGKHRVPPVEEEEAEERELPPQISEEKEPPPAIVPSQPVKEAPVSPVKKAALRFRGLYHLLILVPFVVLVGALLENFRFGLSLKRLTLAATILASLSWLISVWRKWDPRKILLWLSTMAFAVFAYGAFFYPTSETPFLFGFTYAQALAWFWLAMVLLVGVLLFFASSLNWFWKSLVILSVLLTLVAVGLSVSSSQTLEASLWQPVSFMSLPWWGRPVPLSLLVSLPLLALMSLVALSIRRPSGQRFSWLFALPIFLVGLMALLLGSRLLAKQGLEVPGLGAWVGEHYYGQTLVDPQSSEVDLQLVAPRRAGRWGAFFPLQVAASRSRLKGQNQRSTLLVRNQEAQPFLSSHLNRGLRLSRGVQKIKGGQVTLLKGRIGKPRYLVLALHPSFLTSKSLFATGMEIHLSTAILQLLANMSSSDQLLLCQPPLGCEKFSIKNKKQWSSQLDKILKPSNAAVSPKQVWDEALAKLSQGKELKQILYLTDLSQLPPVDLRKAWESQAQQKKTSLSYLVLGEASEPNSSFYAVEGPAALGFQLLSAAAESLGHFQIQFPKVSPLPQVQLSRDQEGEVQLKGGKLAFRIFATQKRGISGLRMQIDDQQSIDLDPAKLNHTLDLATLKILPGHHHFRITLLTTSGDTVTEEFKATYLAERQLKFMKPLAQDTVTTRTNVMVLGAQYPGVQSLGMELLLDGEPVATVTSEPYLFSLSGLTEGTHELQAVQSFSNGQSQSTQVKFQAQVGAAEVNILSPSNGELLSNVAELETEVSGVVLETPEKVDYLLNGEWIGESAQPPYPFLWSNQKVPAGNYYVQARARFASGKQSTDAVQVQLAEASLRVQADPSQYPEGKLFPEHVELLLDASQRMQRSWQAYFPLDLERWAFLELKKLLPEKVQLQTYALGGMSSLPSQACSQIMRIAKQSAKTEEQLKGLSAQGYAPIALGLNQLEKDFGKVKGSRVGILLTGGWDRCSGDPIAIAEQMKQRTPGFRLYVLYFSGLPATEVSLLNRLAEVTGGKAYEISQPEDLLFALKDSTQVHYTLYDFKNSPVLTGPLSQEPISLRSGNYRLEVGTVPALIRDPLILGAGSQESLTVQKQGDSFRWGETVDVEWE